MQGFIRPSGSDRVPLIMVGEGGGKTEARKGEPFVGAAGQVLEKAIRLSGLSRDDYSITNLLHCSPPSNELRGAPYERAALDHCRPFLNQEIADRRPRIILALGEIPFRELCAVKISQAEGRGYVLDSIYDGVKIIGTFHPSRILRGDWKLFPVLKHDLMQAASFAQHGIPQPLPTNYTLFPTDDQIRDYIALLSSPDAPLCSFDVETKSILGEPEPDDWRLKTVIQIQFSSAAGTALVLPWPHEGAKAILATTADKVGWNNRLSDNLVLKHRYGITIGGEVHDGMQMWAHLQPDFASGKDDKSEKSDKSIPSKLMSLQSALSFYYPHEPLWKAAMRRGLKGEVGDREQLLADVRAGGARDADFQFRIGMKLISALRKSGLWEGYYPFKHRLGNEILSPLSDTGLPVDAKRQSELREFIETQSSQLLRELQSLVPEELQSLHPEFGYVNVPKWVEEIKDYDPANPLLIELSNSRGYLVQRMITAQVVNKVEVGCPTCGGSGSVPGKVKLKKCSKCKATGKRWVKDGRISRDELRWCLALFNPSGSSPCTLNYIKYCVENQPLGNRWYVPTHIDTGRDTSGKDELEKLVRAVDDPALWLILKSRKLEKLGGTYCSGDWIPGSDGRVHAEFRFGTATGQISSARPNVQQFPEHYDPTDEWISDIMHRVKGTIRAERGYKIVKVDMRGFHARMQGFLAEDAAFYRLASLDLHSYTTGHYVGVPDKDTMLKLDDAALAQRLGEIKKLYKHDRDYKLKRVSFLMTFLGGAEKAFRILSPGFTSVVEVQQLMDLIAGLFPQTFKKYPKRVEKQLRSHPRIISPFHAARWFWDRDIQQAVAFSVANCAHSTIDAALLRLSDKGVFHHFQMINFLHDAAWMYVRVEDVRNCIDEVREEFQRPSDVLWNETLGAFTCAADAQAGDSLVEMEDMP